LERELLRSEFEHWEIPFRRRFPGARADSLIAIASDAEVVGITYLGDRNELGLDGFGQAHYSVLRPDFRGRGISGPRYGRLLQRASSWGLDGIVIAVERAGLPALYERWGALVVGAVPRDGGRLPGRRLRRRRRVAALRGRAIALLDEHGT
jgi:hypothetical protein